MAQEFLSNAGLGINRMSSICLHFECNAIGLNRVFQLFMHCVHELYTFNFRILRLYFNEALRQSHQREKFQVNMFAQQIKS